MTTFFLGMGRGNCSVARSQISGAGGCR
jgi:hypothetical protein